MHTVVHSKHHHRGCTTCNKQAASAATPGHQLPRVTYFCHHTRLWIIVIHTIDVVTVTVTVTVTVILAVALLILVLLLLLLMHTSWHQVQARYSCIGQTVKAVS